MPRDRRTRRDLHALDENGMVLCNPRDQEAAHRAEVEGIATQHHAAVTCRACRTLLSRQATKVWMMLDRRQDGVAIGSCDTASSRYPSGSRTNAA